MKSYMILQKLYLKHVSMVADHMNTQEENKLKCSNYRSISLYVRISRMEHEYKNYEEEY